MSADITSNLDLIWHVGWFCQDEEPRCSWAGFIHDVTTGAYRQPADIRLLPITDRSPNDPTCIIYSTLLFIQQQSKKLNLEIPCVTFDQPLWLKAIEIVHTEKLKIVCRLGPFHAIMSFLGSLGNLMAGSGLAELLQCCYGSNTVTHMLTGKAVGCALREHSLVQSAVRFVDKGAVESYSC